MLNVNGVDNVNVINVDSANNALLAGEWQRAGVLPWLQALRDAPIVFDIDFGLTELPKAPGVLAVRGARQYGKSTWQARRGDNNNFRRIHAAHQDR